MENLNIIQLIERNPISRLSKDYESKLINKIKSNFTDTQQQIFVSSFYCFLNYDSKKDFVIDFDDSDNSAKRALWMVRQSYPQDKIIFANGGDRTHINIPEMDFKDDNIQFVFGVGGFDKRNSSSWILQEWKAPQTLRPWGYYRVLHEVPGTKVKELTVNPGCTLSMQRHSSRAEYWQVSEGRCVVEGEGKRQTSLDTHDSYHIPTNEWHRLYNPFDQPCRIVEIQYGPNCVEEDIERQ
jgi:mannose-6-phosphate isomerase-like protein (cupin superfamily)